MVLFPAEWVYTLAVWHRGKFTKHWWAGEVLPLLGPSSLEGERKTSESNSRRRAHFKAYKSSPKGAVSVSWQQAWRLKSPVLKLAFVDTHCSAFYWMIIYFLFHRFLPHWVHWREEQAVSVLIYFSCQPLCQPVVFCFIYCQLFRSYSECRKHIIFQSNCEMRG